MSGPDRPYVDASPPSSPAEGVREAWAGDPPAYRAARERLMDATARCIARDGPAGVSIASVAAEAGVSRPTVYRYFADRDELLRVTQHRAGTALAERMLVHLRAFTDPAEHAVEALLFALREIRRDPLYDAVWNGTVLDSASLRHSVEKPALELVRRAIGGLVELTSWTDAEADEVAEWMMRILLSLLVAPGHRSDTELRHLLERRMLPALGLQGAPQ